MSEKVLGVPGNFIATFDNVKEHGKDTSISIIARRRGFILFSRDYKEIFKQNPDVRFIWIYTPFGDENVERPSQGLMVTSVERGGVKL